MSRKGWGPQALPRARRTIASAAAAEADRVAALIPRAEQALPSATPVSSGVADRWRSLGAAMRTADLYWVTTRMGRVALDASQDIPALLPEHVPGWRGLIGFEGPLPPYDTRALGVTVRTGRRIDEQFAGKVQVDAIAWSRAGGTVQIHLMVQPRRLPGPVTGVPFPDLVSLSSIELPLPLDLGGFGVRGPDGTDSGFVGLVSFLATCWVLMMTPTVAERRSYEPTPGAGGHGSGQRPARMTIVDLRPLRHVEVDRDERTGRRLTVRHYVRGHWRDQPHGPGRALRRLTWVAPYIKGPSDAPLKDTETVYVWRR